eukprot:scaffold2026_cov82-Isochrysis_galbana.AAC.3
MPCGEKGECGVISFLVPRRRPRRPAAQAVAACIAVRRMEPSRYDRDRGHRRTSSGEALLTHELERMRELSRQPGPAGDPDDAEVASIFDQPGWDRAPGTTNVAALNRATQHAAAEQAARAGAGAPHTGPAVRAPAHASHGDSPPAVSMFEVETEVSSQLGSPRNPTWLGWRVARISASSPTATHRAGDATSSSRRFDRCVRRGGG